MFDKSDAASSSGRLERPSARRRHPFAIVVGCALGVVTVGAVDYATGVEARVFPLYYIPIAFAALRGSRALGISFALVSTALWAVAIRLAGSPWSPEIMLFNITTQFVSFALVAILVASIARRLDAEHALSRKDNLTALPNSRAFYEFAELLVTGARRSGRPFTIAYVDLDNFKAVNDEHGHRQGDSALIEAAEVLGRAKRASDVAARLGGDEFIVLLPDTGPDVARAVLERLGALIADAMKQRGWPITASIGAVSFLRAPDTLEAAVHCADATMYRAKQAGKNRVLLETIG